MRRRGTPARGVVGAGRINWREPRARGVVGATLAIIVILAGAAGPAWGQRAIPEAAYQYKRAATSIWGDELGNRIPRAILAAQVHQESTWRASARSPFAYGLTQFTPDTAEDMCRWYPELRPCDPGDYRWALRAQAIYMRRLLDMNRVGRPAASDLDAIAFALSGYNGGPGWTMRDRNECRDYGDLCNDGRWFCNVEHYHGASPSGARRNQASRNENRHYVRIILVDLQETYRSAGW